MVFDLTKYVPEVYSDSRDYRVLLKLFGIISTSLKYNIDTFLSLYSPEECPDNLLPLLADLVGYKYNENITINGNRLIIKYFQYLIHNRGSKEGIEKATALCINTSTNTDVNYSLSSLDGKVSFDYDKGLIKIYVEDIDKVDLNFLEYVRPVGTQIQLIPISMSKDRSSLLVKATAKPSTIAVTSESDRLNVNNIGFTNITKGESNNE